MRRFVGYACFALALVTYVPVAFAQAETPLVTTAQQQSMSDEQLRRAVNSALRDRFTAGDQDATIIGADGQVINLSGALGEEEEEEKKKFVYEKPKGAFDEKILPVRVFNNIPYPY